MPLSSQARALFLSIRAKELETVTVEVVSDRSFHVLRSPASPALTPGLAVEKWDPCQCP